MRRWFARLGLVTLTVVALSLGAGCCVFSAPRYHGPKSDHFNGSEFVNESGAKAAGFGDVVRWIFGHRERGPWPEQSAAPPGPKTPYRVERGQLRVTFVNHATTLLQLDGLNVLTDPIWSERASPVSFAGPKRVRPPGIRFEDLPPIDVVVLSHNHYDHFDLATLKRIAKQFPKVKFLAGLGNAALLQREGLHNSEDLDWWQSRKIGEVEIFSVPTQHFSNRGLCDRDATLWTGYVLRSPAGATFFAGDTGFGPQFQHIAERFAPLRLAVLPIGAYRPEWFMGPIHQTPTQAVEAARILQARVTVPMHYGTFNLADDGEVEPVEQLKRALKDQESPNFWVLGFGEGRDVPP